MNKKSTYVLGILLLASMIFNVFAVNNYTKEPDHGKVINPIYSNLKDKVVITFDKEGNTEFIGPNGQKAIKDIKIGHERPLDVSKITDGKPIKTLDVITVFSYNPFCVWQDSRIRCY